jgi:hypothetical protein
MKIELGNYTIEKNKICINHDFPKASALWLTGWGLETDCHDYESTLFVPSELVRGKDIVNRKCKLILEIEE